ncbi:MAG: radical SAM protein, partial [Candidatus Freyarchaeota archaeon]
VGALTLFGKGPQDCKTLYYKALEKHFPELVPKYRSLYRIFFAPPKEYQKELEEKSKKICEKYGIRHRII